MSVADTLLTATPASPCEETATPRFYYGWAMLPLAIAALVASSPGQTFGVSIFNESMRRSLGLTHGQLAFAYMLGTLAAAVPITYVGACMDRHGLRRSLLVTAALFGCACFVTAIASGWFTLFLAFFLLRVLGPGALSFLSGNILAFWFERRLGLVEGIRQVGMAAAMTGIPAFNLHLVGAFGWRGAYLVLGVLIWAILLPIVWLFFRNRPEDVGQKLIDLPRQTATEQAPDDLQQYRGFTLEETLRLPTFWIVTSGTAMFGVIHTAIFFCIVPIFLERNLTAADAAGMLTLFAACLAGMNLIGGALADRISATYLLFAGLFGLGASVAMLYLASSATAAYAGGAVMGLSQGLFFGATHPLWARYFGRLHLGKIRGVLMTVNVGSSALGPLFAGLVRDYLGQFDVALLAFAIAPLPIALLSLTARPPVRECIESTHKWECEADVLLPS